MNEEMIGRLSEIIQVLNNIEVKGKQNLLNLGGGIAMLEEFKQYMITDSQSEKE